MEYKGDNMNNKNFIIVFCVILGILMLGALAFVISSNIVKDVDNETNIPTQNTVVIDDNINDKKDVVENLEEKYNNVVLTSKIGTEVLSKFCISNIYSSNVYEAIDESGLSEEAKLIYTYVTITSNYAYHNMISSSDKLGDYITKENFEIVYKELFGNDSKINHKSVITNTLYHEEEGYYEYLTLGYGGIEFNFIVEVPYEIREYKDRIETSFYRLYCKASSEVTEDGEAKQLVSLYNNSLRKKELYSSDDNKLQNNDSQQQYILGLIEDEIIDKKELETVTYILNEQEDTYYISDVRR